MYVDACAVDIRVIVGVEVRFRGEDAGDSDEGDDEDRVRYSCGSPLEVVLTGSDGAKGWTKNRDMNKAP